jgi:hypothetical protein
MHAQKRLTAARVAPAVWPPPLRLRLRLRKGLESPLLRLGQRRYHLLQIVLLLLTINTLPLGVLRLLLLLQCRGLPLRSVDLLFRHPARLALLLSA